LNKVVDVSRNVASHNLMTADDGMERAQTEWFVSRIKMPFGLLRKGGREVLGWKYSQNTWQDNQRAG
jgi:hypothetical protein